MNQTGSSSSETEDGPNEHLLLHNQSPKIRLDCENRLLGDQLNKAELTSEEIFEDDPIQNAMGDFGRWHLPSVVMVFVYKLPLAWHTMAVIFLAPKVNVKCGTVNVTDPCSAECDEYEYDDSVFSRTIVTQWDLVCERKYLASVAQSIVMLGILIGSIVFGILSDRIGRKIPFCVTVVGLLTTGIATAYIPWFWLFNVMRFLNAFAIGGGLIVSFVSMMEIVGKPLRAMLGITYQIPYWFGHLTLPIFGYFFRDWRHYQMAYSVASAIALPCLLVLYESPRWLFSTGQVGKAAKILTKAAKVNKLPTEGLVENLQTVYDKKNSGAPVKRGNVLDLLKTPNMRMKTIVICYNWLACGMGYYGIAQYAGYLGGNIFVNVAASAALEIPATVICAFMTKYWGRKPTQITSNLLTGISMIIIACLPQEKAGAIKWIVVILVSLGMSGMSMAFANAYLYAGELFPTVVRNAGMGSASMISRIGSILSPFIANMEQLWLSSLIFGVVPVIGAGLCFILPETMGQPLPETLEDGENFGRKKK